MSTTIQDETRRTAAAFPKLGALMDFAAQSHARACLILAVAVLQILSVRLHTGLGVTDLDELRELRDS